MEFRNHKQLWKESALLMYMAEHLSQQNRDEAELLMPAWSIGELLNTFAESSETGFALFDDDGNPYGLGGIASDGNIFFVVREELDMRNNISALKKARKWLARQLTYYPEIWGYCWEKSTKSMEWMRWLGFDFSTDGSPATKIMAGQKFYYFRIQRKNAKARK